MLKRWPNLREILHLLLPMVFTFTLELSVSLIDTIMLGHYDPYHLAAVGLASSLWLPLGCFVMGVNFGLTPLVTRHLHGRQIKLVNIYMSQALGVCLTLGIAMALVVAFVLPFLVTVLANEPETQRLAIQYLWYFSPSIPALAIIVAYKNLFEAAGRPHFPLVSACISVSVNVFLNYLLIYGNFGFPELGAVGAAIASTIAMFLNLTLFFVYDRVFNPVTLFTQLKVKYLLKYGVLLSVGLPAGLAFSLEIVLFSSITWMISSFGDLAIGAGQITMSYTSILFTPLMAISSVATIVVAKSFSQEGVEGVRARMRVILLLGLSYNIVCLSLTQIFYMDIPYLFTSDAHVAMLASGMLVISSWYQIVDMLQTAFTGALRGLRDTRVAMLTFAVSLFGLSLPLGFWLAHYSPWAEVLTVRGFHLGLGAGLTLLAIVLILRFRFLLNKKQIKQAASVF